MILRGTFVPSRDVANSRSTSQSEKSAGDVWASPVRITDPFLPSTRYHAGGEHAVRALVLESRDLRPRPVRVTEVVRKFTAIAICHGREDVTTVVRGCELDLRDSRELLPDDVRVLLFGRPESMEVYLLVEVQVFRGTLPLVRIPGVVEPGSVRGPRDASPRGGVVDSRDPIREFSSGRDVVHVDRPVLAAVPGEGDRNMPAVEGG